MSGYLVGAALFLCASQAHAEYRLGPGDVIEVSVAGIPELRQRASVQFDGSISLPLVSALPIAGLTPSEMQANIQFALATRIFRQRIADGREKILTIEPGEVAATIVEYRPIYVGGDVLKPGEQPYRPQMTVRQALTLAGYGSTQSHAGNAPLESAELRGQYTALWTEFIKEHVHIWRLRSELGEKLESDQKLPDTPLPSSVVSHIAKVETDQLNTRTTDFEREKSFLQRSIKEADQHIDVLTDQQRKEEQGMEADAQELQRMNELLGKGSVTMGRVTEARRALLLSSTRKLQTHALQMQVRRQLSELARQLEKMDDQRRMTLLKELQEANTSLHATRAKLQGIAEKLEFLGGPQATSPDGRRPEFRVYRKSESGEARFVAGPDSELEPGDVIEVATALEIARIEAQ
jgi:polysaccharide export outer membrane protein